MKNIKNTLIAATIMSSFFQSAIAETQSIETEYPITDNLSYIDGKVRVNDFVAIQTFRLTKEDVAGIKVSHNTIRKEDAEKIIKKYTPIDRILLPLGKRYINKNNIIPEHFLFTNIPVKMNRIHAIGDRQNTNLFVDDKNKTGIIQKINHAISFKYDINMVPDMKKHLEKINMNINISQEINDGKIIQDSFNRNGLSKISVVKNHDKMVPYNETTWFAEQTVTGPMLIGITPGTIYNQTDIGNHQ